MLVVLSCVGLDTDTSTNAPVCYYVQGVNDVNYSLYPSQELQRDWLLAYLESFKRSTGREATVTKAEVMQLYVQVCKFSLVSESQMSQYYEISLHILPVARRLKWCDSSTSVTF